jgi:hypothetical protein
VPVIPNSPVLFLVDYEHGWPSYYNIYYIKKNVYVRVVQICVRKLAANYGDCVIFESAAIPF